MTSEPASVPWAAAISACPASIHVPPGLELWFIFIWGKKKKPSLPIVSPWSLGGVGPIPGFADG